MGGKPIEPNIRSLTDYMTTGGYTDSATILDVFETPFDTKPEEFLKFAEDDLRIGESKGQYNSLSNVKRAIDCQMDSILLRFCLYEISKSEKWNFPKKIDVLNKLGIISPRILQKINAKRNSLEHEYKKPTREDVEDAIDVATLFVHYTNKFLFNTPTELEISKEDEDDEFYLKVELKTNERKMKIRCNKIEGHSSSDKVLWNIELLSNSEEFHEYLKWFLTSSEKHSSDNNEK